ncbi:hypothetical protein SAV14893_094990 [Streptomyces avermitilis]|uniref:Uncharacterized protein n=1 Tax=Streptomyces avermitilis TaxID=33903 RepID=A0A4D4ME65_STRAX|nr:hypothetical protein SAV14893_083560 [Streptomyces avermitilis]GDY70106.1 hypothetical protein SAV14893_094990 [Streptomyces avermitilis]GDY80383.1 hypothetical protein SAV31267_098680 [Streptomyces avermitilis]
MTARTGPRPVRFPAECVGGCTDCFGVDPEPSHRHPGPDRICGVLPQRQAVKAGMVPGRTAPAAERLRRSQARLACSTAGFFAGNTGSVWLLEKVGCQRTETLRHGGH